MDGIHALSTRRARTCLMGATLVLALVGVGGKPVMARAQSTATAEEQVATGAVFDDRNRNGRQDDNEPGVADVSVSNGRDVVRTDDEGRYELAVTDETIIFITKPADYMVPVDENQLPQFYYIHYPQGSPLQTRYPGIQPTGALPESVDFPLHSAKVTDFKALLFADPQTRSLGELEDMRADVVRELQGTDAAFGITTGDVVNDPLDLFGPHNEIIATMGVPWWNLPGNHDMNYDVPDDTYATETYKSVYGPTDYSFDYGSAHFINMDNIDYLGQGNGYRGFLNARQLEWLENDLAHVPADKLIVITTHIPLRTEAIGNQAQNVVNLQALLDVLEDREHVFSTSGHDTSNSWHTYMDSGEVTATPPGVDPATWNGSGSFHHQVLAEVRGGGWQSGPTDERGVHAADMADGNPNGYYFLDVQGNDFRMRYKPASLPSSFQSRITFRGGAGNRTLANGDRVWIPSGPSGSAGISPAPVFTAPDFGSAQPPLVEANVFDGGEQHLVEVSFDGGEFAAMGYDPPRFGLTDGDPTGNLDTYIRALRDNLQGSQRPVRPEPSSHIWTAPVPSGLAPGRHTVTVRSTDPYGRTSRTTQVFRIG